MPNIFDIPMPELDQTQAGGVPQMGLMPISQPPVASPQEMALANLFRQQMPNPEDDELKRLREREDAIYARIMKGPRERAKELTAELWKERYGITEKSGKLARIFAGIGEIGRAGGGGKSYVSIPDQARELATKEYQTEVGPLQREASVLSSAQKALKAQSDLTNYRNEQLQIQHFLAQMKNARNEQEIANIKAITPARIQEMAARTGLLNVQAANQEATGGLPGVFGASKAMAGMDPEDRTNILQNIFNAESAKKAAWLKFDPKNFMRREPGQTRVTTGSRPIQIGAGPGGLPIFEERPTRTVSQGADKNVFDPTQAQDAVSKFQQELFGVTQAAEEARPRDIRMPDGQTVTLTPTGTRPQTRATLVEGRTVPTVQIDERLRHAIQSKFPDVDMDLPGAIPTAYQKVKFTGLPKAPTKEETSQQLAIEGGMKLAKTAVTEFINQDLGGVVGLGGSRLGAIKRAFGKSSTGQVLVDTGAKEGLSNYVRAMSGMATTRAELKRYQDIKPNESDHEVTFMQKALTAMIAGAQTEWMSGLGLPKDMREKLMQNMNILDAPRRNTDIALKHMDAARKALRNQSKTYTVEGDPTVYPTKLADKFVWNLVTGTTKEMQDEYLKMFPDGGTYGPAASALRKK